MVGNVFTVTVVVFVVLQPPDVPVTVYTVVVLGVGLILAVVAPVLQE